MNTSRSHNFSNLRVVYILLQMDRCVYSTYITYTKYCLTRFVKQSEFWREESQIKRIYGSALALVLDRDPNLLEGLISNTIKFPDLFIGCCSITRDLFIACCSIEVRMY